MIICIDFDLTIALTDYPKIIEPIPGALQTIEQLYYKEHKLILWTLREGDLLGQAIEWLEENNVYKYFAEVNNNLASEIKKWNSNPRKVAADVYVNDKAIGWRGWKHVRNYFCLD